MRWNLKGGFSVWRDLDVAWQKWRGWGGQLSRDANEVFAVYPMCRLL